MSATPTGPMQPPRRPGRVPVTRYEQHDAMVGGLRLRYIDQPAREVTPATRTLAVIPGHTARLEGFDEMLPILTEHHRVVVVDFPGSGYSDRPVRSKRDYDLRFYEDTFIAFLDHLGIGRAVPVGGSLGGNLVLRLGHRFPERFPILALWSPGGAWTAQPLLAEITKRFAGRWSFWPSVWVQSRFWYSKDHPGRQAALAETFAYYREVMCPGFINMYWGIAADQLAHSLFDIAPDIGQPTLLMWGDQDNGANMGAGVAKLHELLPDNTFHVFPGARHSVEAEIPGPLAERIVAFLADHPPEPA